MSANPRQLTEMLFDGASNALVRAYLFMQQGDIVAKGGALNRAIDIIGNDLKVGLGHEKGEELATNLFLLYNYMVRRLLHANLNNDYQVTEEVEGLFGNIADA